MDIFGAASGAPIMTAFAGMTDIAKKTTKNTCNINDFLRCIISSLNDKFYHTFS